jgi:hypothetical protein
MLGSFACVFLGIALTWNIAPITYLLELKALTQFFLILGVIPIPTLFLTVKAVRGKKWSLSAIALSAVMATLHLTMELPVGIYSWLIGLTFCGIAFYCHVRLINQGHKNPVDIPQHSNKK